MKALLAACVGAVWLSACSAGEQAMESASSEATTAMTDAAAPPIAAAVAPPEAGAPARASSPAIQPGTPAGSPLLAYSYSYEIEAPAAGVLGLLRRHERACQNAGPAVCQVVDAGSRQQGERELVAELSFRAIPAYVQRFRAGLDGDVEGARGEVIQSDIETEDLTRSIVDTEAQIRAARLLRERLEGLIASRPGNLQQLLEIERELARVQGQIDAAESALSVMRARVSMSSVSLSYASRGAALDGGDARPLRDAGDAFLSNAAASLAAIITALSVLLPWLIVLALAGWGLWAVARRRARTPTKPERPAGPPTDFGAGPS